MLQAGLFPDFKGADSLLIWGDAEGIADFHIALLALSRGTRLDLRISGVDSNLLIKVSGAKRLSEVTEAGDGLEWTCSCAQIDEAQGMVAGLDGASSGHHYIAVSGLARQVIVSKAEYPASLRPPMKEFVAYPSRWRIALLALAAAAFVALGLWMGGAFGSSPVSRRYPPIEIFAIGWVSVLFFGLCGAVAMRKLFETSEQLRIGTAGVRSAAWSDQTIPWSEISDVTTWRYNRQKAIILHLRDPARFPRSGLGSRFSGVNRKLTGGDVAISLIGTDRSFNEAMSAIAHFRRP